MPQPGKLLTDFNDGPKPPTPEAMSAVSPNLDDNTRLKLVFDSTLKEYGGQGRPHKETSVLMISWHESMDDLNTSEEVDELGEVFEKNFNFKVVKERIKKDHLSPQFHVEKILYDFISEHDSNVSLLIVYYAGHGVQGKNGLDLMGRRTSHATEEMERRDAIDWDGAERSIRYANADILLLFDCCYAGHIANGVRGSKGRNFEFLGACQPDSVTAMPGPKSFTKALIWALNDLNAKHIFTIQELQERVRDAPGFPRNQYPFHCERHGHCVDRLVLAAIPKDLAAYNNDDFAAPNTEAVKIDEDYLDLRFCFGEKLDTDDVKLVANELKAFIGAIKARTVRWIGLPNLEKVRPYASSWLRRTTGKELKSPMETKTPHPQKIPVPQELPSQPPLPSPPETSLEPDSEAERPESSEPAELALEPEDHAQGFIKRKADYGGEALSPPHSKQKRLS